MHKNLHICSGSSTSSLTSSNSIDSSASSILGTLESSYDDFGLDFFMNEAAASEAATGQTSEDMKNNGAEMSSPTNNPDSTFPETPLHEMPFDWTTAAMEWPQSQFEAVPPPLLPFCQPSNQNNQHNDMRVLGVDLDMLMQSEAGSEPFFEAMASASADTPPPSPDSSSGVVTVNNKPNSMTFEITTPPSSHPPQPRQPQQPRHRLTPHHMACHDYTNKVHYQMPPLELSRPPAPTPATLVTSTTTCNSKRLPRHVVYNSGRPSKYGRPPNNPPSGKTKTRKAKASLDDPDYLAHGTGIPR